MWLFLTGLVVCSSTYSQDAQPLQSEDDLLRQLKEAALHIRSIEADFTQEKYLEVFSEKVISTGKFMFRKEDKIRMEYFSPVNYLMIINGDRLKIVSEGKTNIISLGSNQMMKEMRGMLAACMTGDLTNISSGYTTTYSETPATYIVSIQPKAKTIQAYITDMRVVLSKEDMSVVSLRLTEAGNNYTEYNFTNRTYNTLNSDEMFTIP